jgi:hypothetical protein
MILRRTIHSMLVSHNLEYNTNLFTAYHDKKTLKAIAPSAINNSLFDRKGVLSDNHRINYLNCLCRLSQFHSKTKTKIFRNMSREDVLQFLDSFRKPENIDPLQIDMNLH